MFHVEFTPTAASDLERLNKATAQRILAKIRWLAENFETKVPEPLTGQFEGIFKLRLGDYRILYTSNKTEETIIVHFVRHRSEVYKTK
jgi:mRNA interferase RelE/StbE